MRHCIVIVLITHAAFSASAQTTVSPFNTTYWGVVLAHPEMKNVRVKQDVTFLKDEKGSLTMDIYLPPDLKANEKRPAVIFLNAIGESAGQPKVKSWERYKTWPQLIAANGFIGISMEADRERIQESIHGVFKFLGEKGSMYNIDADKLGVYAAAANVTQSAVYLMKEDAFKGIKAAVLYYGSVPPGPYRKDLPVLFVFAKDDPHHLDDITFYNEVLKNGAPWTIKIGTGLIHAFDVFEDTDEAKKAVKETISFWKNHLEPVQQSPGSPSIPREAIAAYYRRDNNKVVDLTKEWLQDHPNDADALRVYSTSLKAGKRFEEAEPVYKKRLSLQPNDINILVDLAVIMYELDRPSEAQNYIASAAGSGNMKRSMYTNLGSALTSMKKYQESIPYYEKALEMEPRAADYYNVACSYSFMNNKDKAFENLNKEVDLGYNVKANYENDTDLASLKSDSRWNVLVEKLK